jgi:hypothetical protein
MENVNALDIPAFAKTKLNAMHFAEPHQSLT